MPCRAASKRLPSTQFSGRGLYRAKSVTRLLDDHFSGQKDVSNKIFALLMLELWHQKFVDARAECFVPKRAAAAEGMTSA